MTSTAAQMRSYSGPALFSFGFRPFFLFAAAWSVVAIGLFLAALHGQVSLPSAFPPVTWHQHEMVFGYVPAVIAGFLLTAVPNWTGRLPVVGGRLAALFVVWILGRAAVLFSGVIGAGIAAMTDLAFLAALGIVVVREIIAARNWRNLKVVAILAILLLGNAISHAEGHWSVPQGLGVRIAIAATIMLISLIGGRIVPSFTRNWLAKRGPGALPTSFDRLDAGVMVITGVALVAWVASPVHIVTSAACILATIASGWRLSRWAGYRAGAEPLVLVLHIAFAFVPLGFALVAIAGLAPSILTPSGALHGWTAGAIGLMTLAVMTRASLGHTGKELVATRATTCIYLLVIVAALARVGAALGVSSDNLLTLSAGAWIAGFGTFVVTYGPLLSMPRAR